MCFDSVILIDMDFGVVCIAHCHGALASLCQSQPHTWSLSGVGSGFSLWVGLVRCVALLPAARREGRSQRRVLVFCPPLCLVRLRTFTTSPFILFDLLGWYTNV